eukprot:76873_1
MSFTSREGGLSNQSYFCYECQTHRLTLNGQCCQCKQIIEINDKPEGVVDRNNNRIVYYKNNQSIQKEGYQSFEYTFSDSTENNNTNSNRNKKEIMDNISPISFNRNQRKRKHNFNDEPHYKKIKTEIDDDEIVIKNARNKINPIIIDNIDSDNDNEDLDLKQNEIRITIHPDFSNSDSDSDSLSDSVSVTKGNTIRCKPRAVSCSINKLNNRINRLNMDNINGYVSESPSLSVISGINGLTLRHKHQGLNIDKWKELGIRNKTLRGLETLDELNIPQKEGIALINAIRSHMGHIIGSILHHEERLVYLVVGILEIIKFNNNNNNAYSNRKPQVIVVSSRRHSAQKCGQLVEEIGKFYGVLSQTIIGGMPKWECIKKLRGELDVISGTPGMLCGMINHGVLNKGKMDNLIAFVMDDADELVCSESIRSQMKMITSILPDRKIKVLWLESVIRQNEIQSGCRYIRSLDKSIKNMSQEKKLIKCITENTLSTFASRNDDHIFAMCKRYDEKVQMLWDILQCFNGDKWYIVFFNKNDTLFNVFDEFYGKDDRELPR